MKSQTLTWLQDESRIGGTSARKLQGNGRLFEGDIWSLNEDPATAIGNSTFKKAKLEHKLSSKQHRGCIKKMQTNRTASETNKANIYLKI